MKNYLRTQITLYEGDKNYPIWRRQDRRSKYAVQLASWQLRSNSPKTSVRPSICPSVGKVSATFHENYWLNSFHPWDLYLWGKCVDPYQFSCSCPHFWPSGGQKLTENQGFLNFRENCRLDSFHPWDLYLWGKSLDPYRFSCSCPHFWPSGGQKLTENRGFRNFSRKLSAWFI